MQLKQVIPRTQLEQMEYSLAAERRRMRLLHAEIITDLLSSSTAQPGTGGSHGGSVTQRSAVRTADVVFLFWLSQENARSTRMPCRPSRREWRAWSWSCRLILTTKSAPLGARLWRGWRTWLRFLRGVYQQPGPSSPQIPPGEHEGVPGLDGLVLLARSSSCTCSPQRRPKGRWPNDLTWLLSQRRTILFSQNGPSDV